MRITTINMNHKGGNNLFKRAFKYTNVSFLRSILFETKKPLLTKKTATATPPNPSVCPETCSKKSTVSSPFDKG